MAAQDASKPAGDPLDLTTSVAGEEDPGASIDLITPPGGGKESTIGKDVCPQCGGTGRLGASACPECQGTGKVVAGIGGA